MIVSHEHRFIFVKTHKTAGTSIEVALSSIAGDDAIVTPIQPPEPGHDPRNWRGLFNPLPELRDRYLGKEEPHPSRSASRTVTQLRRRWAYRNHLPASVIRARVGKKVWDSYFTFCFERDPWDKTISQYFYATHGADTRPAFESWAQTAPLPSDWHTYAIQGRVAVDFVGRYENLAADLGRALEQVGLTNVVLPRAKGQVRERDVDTPITPPVDARIRQVFAREIEEFGYARPASSIS
jgi:hypothetical protein